MNESGGPAHVVLVEDNPGDVFLIQEALRDKGVHFELRHFSDGEEAWVALAQSDKNANTVPDLILLDLNLPKTEGVSLLRQIREHPALADVPVAVLTSSQSPRDEREAAALGATRYIRKSALLDDFLSEVGGAVREMLEESAGSGV